MPLEAPADRHMRLRCGNPQPELRLEPIDHDCPGLLKVDCTGATLESSASPPRGGDSTPNCPPSAPAAVARMEGTSGGPKRVCRDRQVENPSPALLADTSGVTKTLLQAAAEAAFDSDGVRGALATAIGAQCYRAACIDRGLFKPNECHAARSIMNKVNSRLKK